MIIKKVCFLFLVLFACGTNVYTMKRSAVEILNEQIQGLPEDVFSNILSYVGLSKTVLMQISKNMYSHFCFKNYLTTDHTLRENWKYVCHKYPWLIAANRYDCQRIYYLLIKEDNLALMEHLLRVDERRKENMKEVIIYLFNSPFVDIGSEQMRDLICSMCLGEDERGAFDCTCQIHEENKIVLKFCGFCRDLYPNGVEGGFSRYNQEAVKQKNALVNCVMGNTIEDLEKREDYKHIKEESFCYTAAGVIIFDFFNCLLNFCSEASREKLISFFKLSDLDKNYEIVTIALSRALQNNNYSQAQYFIDHGANVNDLSEDQQVPLLPAIHAAVKKNDYGPLLFLAENEAILDLDCKREEYGLCCPEFDEEVEERLVSYFGGVPIEDIVSEVVSPLLYAVIIGNQKLLKTLLDYGACSYAPQSCEQEGGDNPTRMAHIDLLDIAKALGNQEIIDTIVQARERIIPVR